MIKFTIAALSLPLLLSPAVADSCHPGAVRDCLARFESVYAWCGEDENCMCDAIITTGAMCYSDCPASAIEQFIETYDNGRCKSYNRYPSPIPDLTTSPVGITTSSVPVTVTTSSGTSHPTNTLDMRLADRARSWFGLGRRQVALHVGNEYFEDEKISPLESRLETSSHLQSNASITSVRVSSQTGTSRAVTYGSSYVSTGPAHVSPQITGSTSTRKTLSPAEQAASISRQREKENLRSIRASRASESSAALLAASAAKTAPAQATAMENKLKSGEKTLSIIETSGANDVFVSVSAGLVGGVVLVSLNLPLRLLVGAVALSGAYFYIV